MWGFSPSPSLIWEVEALVLSLCVRSHSGASRKPCDITDHRGGFLVNDVTAEQHTSGLLALTRAVYV